MKKKFTLPIGIGMIAGVFSPFLIVSAAPPQLKSSVQFKSDAQRLKVLPQQRYKINAGSKIPLKLNSSGSTEECGATAPDINIVSPNIVVSDNEFTIKVELSCKPSTITKVQLITFDQNILPVPQPNGNMLIVAGSKEGEITQTAGYTNKSKYVKLMAVLPDYAGKSSAKNVWVERN